MAFSWENAFKSRRFSLLVMLINPSPAVPAFGIVITLILLGLLISFELLPEACRVQGFYLGASVVFLAAFIFIILQRLEGIL